MGDRPTLLLLLEPIPLHYDPSYHRCLLHLLLSFLSRSASTMTRGAIMSTSFQDSFTPSFESYRSSSYLSFLPSIHRLSLSLSLCSTKSSFARLYTPLFPLVILPVLLFFPGNFPCFSFIFFLSLFFFSFCKSSLSFSPFLSFSTSFYLRSFFGITLTSLLS